VPWRPVQACKLRFDEPDLTFFTEMGAPGRKEQPKLRKTDEFLPRKTASLTVSRTLVSNALVER
jgi:hypothetical protein